MAKKSAAKKPAKKTTKPKATARKTAKPKLVSGGNPQIAKGYGDAPVQAYIAAVPDWRRDICVRLDAIITKAAPGVKKAVKWNSPFYGMEGRGWFVSYHIFARYVKVNFFFGRKLDPLPPVGSKDPNARYVHLHEDGIFDEAQFIDWVKQAAKLPGWMGH